MVDLSGKTSKLKFYFLYTKKLSLMNLKSNIIINKVLEKTVNIYISLHQQLKVKRKKAMKGKIEQPCCKFFVLFFI